MVCGRGKIEKLVSEAVAQVQQATGIASVSCVCFVICDVLRAVLVFVIFLVSVLRAVPRYQF